MTVLDHLGYSWEDEDALTNTAIRNLLDAARCCCAVLRNSSGRQARCLVAGWTLLRDMLIFLLVTEEELCTVFMHQILFA
jgi:hypothetical protein